MTLDGMTADLTDAAHRLRISTPKREKERQPCPECSHQRAKFWEKCLKVRVRDGAIAVYCHHCRWGDAA